jgi:hypothetical protein
MSLKTQKCGIKALSLGDPSMIKIDNLKEKVSKILVIIRSFYFNVFY